MYCCETHQMHSGLHPFSALSSGSSATNLIHLPSPRSGQTSLPAYTTRTPICASNLLSWQLSGSSRDKSLALESLSHGISFRSRSTLVGIFPSLATNEERRIASSESVDKWEVNMHVSRNLCIHFTHQRKRLLFGLEPKSPKSLWQYFRIVFIFYNFKIPVKLIWICICKKKLASTRFIFTQRT